MHSLIFYHESSNPAKTEHCHYCVFRSLRDDTGCCQGGQQLGFKLTGRDCGYDDGHYSSERF